MTGDPKRVVPLGFGREGTPEIVSFSFDSFVAPAHRKCNEGYSLLESSAKSAIERVLSKKRIAVRDVRILLDWMDKVRVSVWLLHRMNSNNLAGVVPRYHVDQRMGNSDRILAIYVFPDHPVGLGAACTSTPVFSVMPSVFALRINSFVFVSAATDALCAKPMGLPWIAAQSRKCTVREAVPPVASWRDSEWLSELPTPSALVGQAVSPVTFNPAQCEFDAGTLIAAEQSEPIDFLDEPPSYLGQEGQLLFRDPPEAFTLGHVVRSVMRLQLTLWEVQRGQDDAADFAEMVTRLQTGCLENWDRHYPDAKSP